MFFKIIGSELSDIYFLAKILHDNYQDIPEGKIKPQYPVKGLVDLPYGKIVDTSNIPFSQASQKYISSRLVYVMRHPYTYFNTLYSLKNDNIPIERFITANMLLEYKNTACSYFNAGVPVIKCEILTDIDKRDAKIKYLASYLGLKRKPTNRSKIEYPDDDYGLDFQYNEKYWDGSLEVKFKNIFGDNFLGYDTDIF